MDNNAHISTFQKWQNINGSAWTNSSKHQTMQQAQGTTPQKQHCMHMQYNTFTIKIIPTAMWAAHTMQAAHTVWPADQKPDY